MKFVSHPLIPPLLEVNALKTYYFNRNHTIRAVDGVSFSLHAGATMGVAGESGCGKTQTAMSIMGLVRDLPGIVGGEVIIQGHNVLADIEEHVNHGPDGTISLVKRVSWRARLEKRMAALRGRVVSMIFQEPKSALIPYYTVRQHFQESYRRILELDDDAEMDEQASTLLGQFDFDKPANTLEQYPHQLSGGETQRIMIALSMIGDARLLIADEPTTALDAVTQRIVLEQLQEAIAGRGMGMLLISHNLAMLAHLVEFIAVMFGGRIVEFGRTADIIRRDTGAQHPYTKALLNAFRPASGDSAALQVVDTRKNHSGCVYYYRCTLKDMLPEDGRNRCRNQAPPVTAIDGVHQVACWAHTS